jgi:hypothetical protein
MYSPDKIYEVQRLLSGGRYSFREIARLAGVHRNTVRNIALGTRQPREFALQRRRAAPAVREAQFDPESPPARCPSCGRLVRLPCHACFVERNQLAGRIRPLEAPRPGRPRKAQAA